MSPLGIDLTKKKEESKEVKVVLRPSMSEIQHVECHATTEEAPETVGQNENPQNTIPEDESMETPQEEEKGEKHSKKKKRSN